MWGDASFWGEGGELWAEAMVTCSDGLYLNCGFYGLVRFEWQIRLYVGN